MPPAQLRLETRQIEPGDKVTGLSCGNQKFIALKIFLERHAKTYHSRHLGRTYATFDGIKIVGYITLVCGEIVLEGPEYRIREDGLVYDYKSYPAVKIARLLVDARYRNNDIGEDLVKLALGVAKDIVCNAVGCRFVVVDSKQESVEFYKRQGFAFLDTAENKARAEPIMFVDLHKAN